MTPNSRPERHCHTLFPVFMLLMLSASPLAAGKLFKWTDDQGRVRYGDKIPAQYAKQRQETLNEQGIVVDTKPAAKTPQQRAEEARLAKIAAEKKRRRDEAAAYDRVLLDTFTAESDMIKVRDDKIEAVEATVRLTRARTEKTRQRLRELTQRAANLERAGRAIPDPLRKEINDARDQIEYNDNYVKNRLKDQARIRAKFEADLKRFRELKQIEKKQQQALNRESAYPPLHP